MVQFSHVSEAIKKLGTTVTLRGWVHRKRESGGLAFIIIRDSTGILQTATKKDAVDATSWKAASDTTIESSVIVTGKVKEDKRAPTGYELSVEKFENVGIAEPFPITEYQSTELLLDKRHLWLRSQKMMNIMKVRALVFRYIRDFFAEREFWEVTPPILTKAGGESGSDMFETDFFGTKAYLTQSSQLYLEAMMPSLEKVYDLVPSFRAEKSRTTKHLAEYWHLEAEMAYYSCDDNMKLQEDLVSYICQKVAKEQQPLLEALGVDKKTLEVVKPPFKRMTYKDALDYLKKHGQKKEWLDDIGAEDEKVLTEKEDKPIFISKWPIKIKSFYMRPDPDDPEFVLNADLQAPHGHGEIIGGSERISDYATLHKRIKELGLNPKNYEWYMDTARYGAVPHSGFGLGTERTIKWILNLDHIRDAIPFPRMINRAEP